MTGVLCLQLLFHPSILYQSLFYLFLGQQALPASLVHIPPDIADWNLVTPVISGTATWCLLLLISLLAFFQKVGCCSSGLSSKAFMHFLDKINFPVAGPQCSYQVMYSITYICKTNASFCQRGRSRPSFCLQIQEELLPHDAQTSSCHTNPMFSRWRSWQGFSAITEVPAQVIYTSV